ncbi:hypothetical protein [Candidatus Soleaferrea massiliensis]|uniref:hypothetical protein n=1 Tax=Candidatus Soleaferrea massiliensis TaxID=1470354 RepID=UPI00058D5282|nr:hypothetical protein [Candidatus Soleaferrea massiliensis]
MAELYLTLEGSDILRCAVSELPFTEAGILKGCVRFFDDHHPCFIHRTAVRARYVSEFEEFIAGHCCTFPTELDVASLPPELAEIINVKNLKKIKISSKEDST